MIIRGLYSPNFIKKELALSLEVDYFLYQEKAKALLCEFYDEHSLLQWNLFCQSLNEQEEKKAEKFLIQQVAFQCLANPVSSKELAQFILLAFNIKSIYGVRLFQRLLEAEVPKEECFLEHYLKIFQLLINLEGRPTIPSLIKECLPSLQLLQQELNQEQEKHLATLYPSRDIAFVFEHFSVADDLTQYPLSKEELEIIKPIYRGIQNKQATIKDLPSEKLSELFLHAGQQFQENEDPVYVQDMIAIMAQMIRRIYKISPFDTQIIAILALLTKDETYSGRIAQIKTGEGKSTILAMLAAFEAAKGQFVDLITSSGYLAERDCKKYSPFFKALGLTASCISHESPTASHFQAQILFGTNADFEFALLRDGLNEYQLRLSYPLGSTTLCQRNYDVVIIDEVDNMLLSTNGAARIAMGSQDDYAWIYSPILNFIHTLDQKPLIFEAILPQLKTYLEAQISIEKSAKIKEYSNEKLLTWLKSAFLANRKQENKDYVIVENDIRIVDYMNTGRIHQGSQWQSGLHQFLQAKHGLPITSESLTSASICHSTFFNLYTKKIGVTGTMGELVERQEIEKTYGIKSFDIPPHAPCQRIAKPSAVCLDIQSQYLSIVQSIAEMQSQGRPSLVLFETIADSKTFSAFLKSNGITHQVLNDTQIESEEYLIARSGQPQMVTIATNTAGRGTDIILASESKKSGGLHVIFTFYPENSRVEGQGNGRAGRQGDPGSCEKILLLADPHIQRLLAPLDHIELFKSELNPEEKIMILDQLRTEKITHESAQRQHTAALETIYYHYLNRFFKQLRHLYTVFKEPSLIQQWMTLCQSDLAGSVATFTTKDDFFKETSISYNAKDLIKLQMRGVEVDWSLFIGEFQKDFIQHLQELWSQFYTKMTEETAGLPLDEVEKVIQAQYEKLDLIHNFSVENAFSKLQELLYHAKKESLVSSASFFQAPTSLKETSSDGLCEDAVITKAFK